MFGRPVIATSIGALAERVRDGIDGFTFPLRDARALGELIAALCGDVATLGADVGGDHAAAHSRRDVGWVCSPVGEGADLSPCRAVEAPSRAPVVRRPQPRCDGGGGLGVADARVERQIAVFRLDHPQSGVEVGLGRAGRRGEPIDEVEEASAIENRELANLVALDEVQVFLRRRRPGDDTAPDAVAAASFKHAPKTMTCASSPPFMTRRLPKRGDETVVVGAGERRKHAKSATAQRSFGRGRRGRLVPRRRFGAKPATGERGAQPIGRANRTRRGDRTRQAAFARALVPGIDFPRRVVDAGRARAELFE